MSDSRTRSQTDLRAEPNCGCKGPAVPLQHWWSFTELLLKQITYTCICKSLNITLFLCIIVKSKTLFLKVSFFLNLASFCSQDWRHRSHRLFVLLRVPSDGQKRGASILALHVLDDWRHLCLFHSLGNHPQIRYDLQVLGFLQLL